MFDLYVDPTSGDLAFDKGGLRLVKAPNKRVRQELETTLRTFQGEWFNNLSFGGINRAYIGRIGVTKEEVDAWYRRTILANPEVLELVEFESSWNRQTRRYELEFTVRTAAGTESSLITISPEASTEYVQPPQSDYTPPTTPSIKVMSAFITGTSSISALISQEAIQIAAEIIVGTGAIAASAVREFVAATVEGSSPTTSATIVKDISATISGSHTVVATMTTVMSAVITSNIGDLSAAIQKVLSSSISGSGSIQASLSKTLAATISGSSTVTAGVAFGFSANIAGTSNVSSSFVKRITANVSATSTTQANMFRVMGASVTASGDVSASLAKRLQANVPATSTTTANIRKAMSSTVVGVSSVTAIARKNLAANITSAHNITATIGKGARATLTGTHTISANIRKIKYTGANISGSGNISGNITKIRNLSANISGGVNTMSASGFVGKKLELFDFAVKEFTADNTSYPQQEKGSLWRLMEPDSEAIVTGAGYRDILLAEFPSFEEPLTAAGPSSVYPTTQAAPVSRLPNSNSVQWSSSANYLQAFNRGGLPAYNRANKWATILLNIPSFGATEDLITIHSDYWAYSLPTEPYTWYDNAKVRVVINSTGRVSVVFQYNADNDPATLAYNGTVSLPTNRRMQLTVHFSASGTSVIPSVYVNGAAYTLSSPVNTNGFSWEIYNETAGYDCTITLSAMTGVRTERFAYFSGGGYTVQEVVDGLYLTAIRPSYDDSILAREPLLYLPLEDVHDNNQLIDMTDIYYIETERTTVANTGAISGYTPEVTADFIEPSGSLAAAGVVGGTALVSGNINTSDLSDRYSICFWHRKPAQLSSSALPYNLWSTPTFGGGNGIGFLQETATNYVFNFVNGTITFAKSAIPLNQDLFIVCKVNKSNQTASVWVNGVLISSSVSGANWSTNWALWSGFKIDSDYPSGTSFFAGTNGNSYERFSIIPADLTQAEIQELYRIGNKW